MARSPNCRSSFLKPTYHVKFQTLRACIALQAPHAKTKPLMGAHGPRGPYTRLKLELYAQKIQRGSRSEVTTSDLAHRLPYQLDPLSKTLKLIQRWGLTEITEGNSQLPSQEMSTEEEIGSLPSSLPKSLDSPNFSTKNPLSNFNTQRAHTHTQDRGAKGAAKELKEAWASLNRGANPGT